MQINAKDVLAGDVVLFNGVPWKVVEHVGNRLIGEHGSWVLDYGFGSAPLMVNVRRSSGPGEQE